jgi:Flp pilus assembly protein TadD/mono/diheme cytochrome c family protein
MRRCASIGLAVLSALLFLIAIRSGLRPPGVHAAQGEVTWRRQIAPIVYKNCTGCHHTGGSGPFALATYDDAKRWGKLMRAVTQSRYMPPWLPEPGYGHFAGDRRLGDEDVALINSWVQAGMPEGDGPIPSAPVYSNDWVLGTPDLVLEMPTDMHVPAGGTDLFENFVLPVPITRTRWVRAMEIKPGSPQVTHHANVIIDRTASIRRAHPDDWQKGIPGMDILVDSGDKFDPDSHFLFWKPDSTALVEPDDMPWRLDPGNDLVLNMHLKPTGKPESVRARIGLYFTDKPATEQPMLLQLENDAALDIPADDSDFVVQDQLKLPVAVDVLGIYPHAHYLGKRMEAWATLPNGEKRWLVLIKSWDINRQSVYRLEKPLPLPANSVIHMRYTYDNSAANIRNPNSPPIRVRAGNRSTDEMGHFWLQVLPHPPAGSHADPRIALERAWMENRLTKNPNDELAEYNLASLLLQAGDSQRSAQLYRKVLLQRPDDARTLTSLGSALEMAGDIDGANAEFHAAITKDPGYADAAFDLAALDLRHNQFDEAERLFRQLAITHPEDTAAQVGLGDALLAKNDAAAAKTAFEQALSTSPSDFDAVSGLAQAELATGDLKAAESRLQQALALRDDPDAHRELALTYAAEGSTDKALMQLEQWERLAPNDVEAHRALAQVYRQVGDLPDALHEERKVVQMAPRDANDWNDLGAMEAQSGDKISARRDLQHALALDPHNHAALENLRKL